MLSLDLIARSVPQTRQRHQRQDGDDGDDDDHFDQGESVPVACVGCKCETPIPARRLAAFLPVRRNSAKGFCIIVLREMDGALDTNRTCDHPWEGVALSTELRGRRNLRIKFYPQWPPLTCNIAAQTAHPVNCRHETRRQFHSKTSTARDAPAGQHLFCWCRQFVQRHRHRSGDAAHSVLARLAWRRWFGVGAGGRRIKRRVLAAAPVGGRFSDASGGKTKAAGTRWLPGLQCRKTLLALASSAWQVAWIRSFDRVGKGIRSALRDALIVDLAPPALRARAFGVQKRRWTILAPYWAPCWRTLGGRLDVGFENSDPGFRDSWVLSVLVLAFLVPEPPKHQSVAVVPTRLEWKAISSRMRGFLMVTMLFTFARVAELFVVLRAHELADRSPRLLLWAAFNIVRVGCELRCRYPRGPPRKTQTCGTGLDRVCSGHVSVQPRARSTHPVGWNLVPGCRNGRFRRRGAFHHRRPCAGRRARHLVRLVSHAGRHRLDPGRSDAWWLWNLKARRWLACIPAALLPSPQRYCTGGWHRRFGRAGRVEAGYLANSASRELSFF